MKGMSRFISVIFVSLLFTFSCGKPSGEFAFQAPFDKSYKKNQDRLEFDSSQEIKWIYKFKDTIRKRTKLGVIIMKKELGWVDVFAMPEYIDEIKNIVYGTIKDFEPGEYKIVITKITEDETIILDQCAFYLFSDDEFSD